MKRYVATTFYCASRPTVGACMDLCLDWNFNKWTPVYDFEIKIWGNFVKAYHDWMDDLHERPKFLIKNSEGVWDEETSIDFIENESVIHKNMGVDLGVPWIRYVARREFDFKLTLPIVNRLFGKPHPTNQV